MLVYAEGVRNHLGTSSSSFRPRLDCCGTYTMTVQGRKSLAGGGSARDRRRRSSRRRSASRRALLVLGMHRSGTSAITRVFASCGARLPANTMAATEHNPRGYFESQPIFELHEAILASAASPWDDLSSFPRAWFESKATEDWVERMTAIVRAEFGEAGLFAIKDPRICRLVPFWLRVLERVGAQPVCVLPVRNPLEVARSLRIAQGTEETRGLALWLRHFLEAERETRGLPRAFVSYDDLLLDWRGVVQRVESELGISFPRRGARAEAEVDDFLSGRLRHQAARPEELRARPDAADWVAPVYGWAQRAAAGESPDPAVLDAVAAELGVAERVFGRMLAASDHARQKADRRIARLEEEIRGLRQAVARREATIAELQGSVERGRENIRELVVEVEARGRDLGRLRSERDEWRAEAQGLRRERDATRREAERIAEGLRGERDRVQSSLDEQRAESSHLAGVVTKLEGQLQALDAERQKLAREQEELVRDLARRSKELERFRGEVEARESRLAALQEQLVHARQGVAERDLLIDYLREQLGAWERFWPHRWLRGARGLGTALRGTFRR